ncbi:MAG: hypothetical protein P1V35_15435 [Planctomycetota bacterium]|nr:hypothetical protein [Planctomycetota bacterium]
MELDQAWTGLIPAVLVAGALLCLCMGVLDNATDKEKWYAWACIFSGAFVLSPLLWFFAYLGGRTGQEQVSREQALEYVDGGFRQHTSRPFNAGSLGGPAWYLGTDGGQAPNLRELEKSLHEWIDLNPPSEDGKAGVNYLSLLDVAYLGLLRDDDLRLFRKDYSQRMLLESDKPLRSPRHDVMQILLRQLEDPLTESEADWVSGRVLRGAKEFPRYNGAEDLYFRMMILESLGKYDEVEELRDKAHAQLTGTWTVQLDGTRGCFVAGLETLEPSELVPEPRRRLYSGWMPSSDYSFRLMIRFGVPEGVDLALFDKYLAEIAMKYRTSDMYANHAKAAAMRSLLHSIHEWEEVPPPTTLEKWSRYRLVLAVLVLSLFCVFVTMRTPKTVVEVEEGTATV